jgi:hypothetical protein
MRIEYDYDHDANNNIVARHFIETTPGLYPQFTVAAVSAVPVDVIQVLKAFHAGTIPIAGTGWDVITKHPTYPGQTRMAALVGEIVRLNDAAARTVLGV